MNQADAPEAPAKLDETVTPAKREVSLRTVVHAPKGARYETYESIGSVYRGEEAAREGMNMNGIELPARVWHTTPRPPALEAGVVHVWRTTLQPKREWVTALKDILNSEERTRAARYVRPHDRDAFIVARGTLRRIMGGYLWLAPQALKFDYNEFGKPYLRNGGASPPLHFNVSHSGAFALYAFSIDGRIGIDVEQMRSDVELESIAQRYFARAEALELCALPQEHQLAAFFHCWVRKEAYLKASGRGIGAGLDRFEVPVALDEVPGKVRATEFAPGEPEWWIHDIPLSRDYAAALVLEGILREVKYWIYEGG